MANKDSEPDYMVQYLLGTGIPKIIGVTDDQILIGKSLSLRRYFDILLIGIVRSGWR